ncbi:hypothetical protein RFI_18925, partial [Reticulomyxa filosa]
MHLESEICASKKKYKRLNDNLKKKFQFLMNIEQQVNLHNCNLCYFIHTFRTKVVFHHCKKKGSFVFAAFANVHMNELKCDKAFRATNIMLQAQTYKFHILQGITCVIYMRTKKKIYIMAATFFLQRECLQLRKFIKSKGYHNNSWALVSQQLCKERWPANKVSKNNVLFFRKREQQNVLLNCSDDPILLVNFKKNEKIKNKNQNKMKNDVKKQFKTK